MSAVGSRKTERRKPTSSPAKKAGKKPSPMKQSFAQLCEKMDKLEKAIKKDAKKKKRCHSDSNSNSEKGLGLSSIGKVVINLGETCKKPRFIPPSPMKATPPFDVCNGHDICVMSSSDDDVTVTSSTKNEELCVTYSTPTNDIIPEGKTTAVVAVMRGPQ